MTLNKFVKKVRHYTDLNTPGIMYVVPEALCAAFEAHMEGEGAALQPSMPLGCYEWRHVKAIHETTERWGLEFDEEVD